MSIEEIEREIHDAYLQLAESVARIVTVTSIT